MKTKIIIAIIMLVSFTSNAQRLTVGTTLFNINKKVGALYGVELGNWSFEHATTMDYILKQGESPEKISILSVGYRIDMGYLYFTPMFGYGSNNFQWDFEPTFGARFTYEFNKFDIFLGLSTKQIASFGLSFDMI